MRSKIAGLIFILTFGIVYSVCGAPDEVLLSYAKKGIVSIRVRTSNSAYSDMGESYGTGFVVNRDEGILLTNRHVVGTASSATYDVTFHNGREAEAYLMYFDAWQDFAFLRVDPQLIPEDAMALDLKPGSAYLDQSVFIVGKNAGQNFSVQTGQISDLHESAGALPAQSMRISLNTRGGGSGSPVLDSEGKVVGLIHSSNMDSFAVAMHIEYAADALRLFLNKQKPVRKGAGALLEYYSLDKAAKYARFPEEQIIRYLEKYPNAFNQALSVQGIIPRSPAEDVLRVGDIIHAIDGIEIGPNLYLYDKLANETQNEFLRFTVWREGELRDCFVGTYDINEAKINRMLSFGGALFYEVDDVMSTITGVSKGDLMVTNVRPGTSFYDVFPGIPGTNYVFIKIVSMDGEPVASLDDLIEQVPHLLERKHFMVSYENQGFQIGYNNHPYFSKVEAQTAVSLSPLDGPPQVYGYNPERMQWEVVMSMGE